MRREKIVGLLAVTAVCLFAGCSGSVETGPVPTITPRPTVTPAPTLPPTAAATPTPAVEESVYDTKLFKEYYERENELPQLKVAFEDSFTIGLDALQIDVTDAKRAEIVKAQYDNISVKEDLSPNVLMDYEASAASGDKTRIALDFSGADVILKFAQENNIPVRGPRLITNETPAWAFTRDFSEAQVTVTEEEALVKTTTIEYASADVIRARMENYIKDVITYCNTNYPGVVVSWDVLDDVILTSGTHELGYRDSFWQQGIGDEYLVEACRFAKQYATEEQKLFLTQDALDESAARNAALALIDILKAENLIDGVAVQAHYNPNGPNVFAIEDMFKALAATGLEIHVTEFYVDSNEGTVGDEDMTKEELLTRVTKRYKNLMSTFLNMEKKSYDIVNITFEGLTDDTSSLNQPKEYIDVVSGEVLFGVKLESYPYLFDKDLNVKESFFATIGDTTIKGY